MGLLEQQNFLAKLYTDESFRQKFITEPKNFGKKYNLNQLEIADILVILPDEINAFADSLFYKRLREVGKFLPLTKRELQKDFETMFRGFAKTFSPNSVKKHLEDAIKFAEFLQIQNIKPFWIKDLIKLEKAKLEFGGLQRKFIFEVFNFDIRQIYHTSAKENRNLKERKTFGIWLRIGKFYRHFIL